MKEDLEKLRRDIDSNPKLLTYFGLIAAMLASFGGGYWRQPILIGAGAALVPAALLMPRTLRFIYLPAAAVSIFIGQAVSRLVMIVIFFGLITPLGVLRRLFGQDPLGLGFREGVSSYWRDCEAVESERPESMY